MLQGVPVGKAEKARYAAEIYGGKGSYFPTSFEMLALSNLMMSQSRDTVTRYLSDGLSEYLDEGMPTKGVKSRWI